MRWFVMIVLASLVISSPVLAKQTAELIGAPVGNDAQPTVPIWQGARAILWDNGPMITHPGGGSAGADVSVLQSALGMNTYGFGHQFYYGYRIGDDFMVDAGDAWCIDSFTFFAYQTGSTTVSTITAVYFEIWDGYPGAVGSSIVYGDFAVNAMTASDWSGIYRTLDTNLFDTQRPIMADVCALSVPLALGPGAYWIVWQSDGYLSSGPWAPPVTVLGETGSGNGIQSLDNGVTWAGVVDSGTLTPQDFPFIIEGSHGPTATDAATWGGVKSLYR